MQNIVRGTLPSVLLLFLISLATVFFRLGALPFIGADEPRYARIAEEMQAAGNWVTPTLEHRPWLEKPPLYYWLTIPFYAVFGTGETTARIGTALATLMLAFAVFLLGTRLWGRLAGFAAASMTLTSVGVAAFGRSASTDMPFTACLTVALAIMAAAVLGDGLAPWKVLSGFAFLGLALLAKGPVALLLAAGILLLFWCLDERGGSFLRLRVFPGLLVCLAVSAPWFWLAFRENGFAFIAIFLVNHNLARYISDLHHHPAPAYYYLPVLAGLVIPWSGWLILLVPEALSRTIRRWREWDRAALFMACWIVFPLVFFSASSSKLPGYILPAIPPLMLLIAARVAKWVETGRKPPLAGSLGWVHLGISAALAAAFPLATQKPFGIGPAEGLMVSAAFFVPALLVWAYLRRGKPARAVAATVAQSAIVILALTQFAYPGIGRYHSARDIARRLVSVRERGEPAVSYRFFHHALHYYAGYSINEDLKDIFALDAFLRGHDRFLVVTEASRLPEIGTLPGLSLEELGEQGKLRLFRLTRR